MKNIFLAVFCLMLSMLSFGQEWTSEQLALLDKYGLEKTDHRGLILIKPNDSEDHYECETVFDALEYYFKSSEKKDLLVVEVKEFDGIVPSGPIGIFEITGLFIELKSKKH